MQQEINNDYLPNNINTKDGNINGRSQEVMKDPLKTLTFIITIYPILPLAMLSMVVIVISFGGVIQELFTRGLSLTQMLGYMGLLIWLLGGTAGLVGLLRILKEKIDLTSLLLIIYGAISYSIVAVVVIMTHLNRPDFISIIHAAFLAFSLVIIGMLIIKTFKIVFNDKNKVKARV